VSCRLAGVDVDLQVNERWRTVAAGVTDRSGMTRLVRLGGDVVESDMLDVGKTVEE